MGSWVWRGLFPFAMMTGKDRQYHNFSGPVIAWYNDFYLQLLTLTEREPSKLWPYVLIQRNINKTHKKITTTNAEIKTKTLKSVAPYRVIPMVDFLDEQPGESHFHENIWPR